jgi:ribosomal protein S18 acetylase RimI-like enzyme
MPDYLPETFVLRQATPDDHTIVLHLMRQFCGHFSYPFNEVARRRAVAGFLTNPNLGLIWLIESEIQAIGYLALTYGFTFEFGGRDAFVDEFYITPNYRNQGLGKHVLASIQQKTSELSLFALHLQTESYNGRAQKLYENLGFVNLRRNTLTWDMTDSL